MSSLQRQTPFTSIALYLNCAACGTNRLQLEQHAAGGFALLLAGERDGRGKRGHTSVHLSTIHQSRTVLYCTVLYVLYCKVHIYRTTGMPKPILPRASPGMTLKRI